TFLLIVIYALLNYAGSTILIKTFGSATEMSNFIGELNGISSLIILPIQLFLLSRLVGRIGLANSSLLYPLMTLASSALLIVFPADLASATMAYVDRTTLRFTIYDTNNSLLYNAVPTRIKGRARAFVDGLVVPIGLLVGSGLL